MRLEFTRADMADIFDYKHCDHKGTMLAASEVLGPGMERKRKSDWNHAVKEAIRYGWDNCGAKPGEILTDEHHKKIAQLKEQKLRAHIANLQRPRPAPPGFTPETGFALASALSRRRRLGSPRARRKSATPDIIRVREIYAAAVRDGCPNRA